MKKLNLFLKKSLKFLAFDAFGSTSNTKSQSASKSNQKSQGKECKVIFAGGGSGGHLFAALAIASEMKLSCGLIGAINAGAASNVQSHLMPFFGLNLGGLNRVGVKKAVFTLFQLPFAFFQSLYYLILCKSQVVIGIGGYSSAPVLVAAFLLKKLGFKMRIAVLEQNSIPGMANRLLHRFISIDLVLCHFASTRECFPKAKKIIVVGNPVRKEIVYQGPPPMRPFQILVLGGSQGSVGLNQLVLDAARLLPKETKSQIQWVHQVGGKDQQRVQKVQQEYEAIGLKNQVQVLTFIDQMSKVYANSSLIISRSGASTLAEIATVGRCAIFVPLPTSTDQHQDKNALSFAEFCPIVQQLDSQAAEKLSHQICLLFDHQSVLVQRCEGIRALAHPHCAQNCAKLIEELMHQSGLEKNQ